MLRLGLALVAAAWMLADSAAAQGYPTRPVKILVPNAAGSLNDTLARLVFAKVSEKLGQQFVIENRAGAAGTIAAVALATAEPDGYTLMVAGEATMVTNTYTQPKLSYNPNTDFAPVILMTHAAGVIIANPALGVKTIQDFVKLAKEKPGELNYASAGFGHGTHVSMAMFVQAAGINIVHVPHNGTTPALQSVIGGQVAAFLVGTAAALPLIADNKVVALAVIGPREKDVLPNVPDLESIYPGTDYVGWHGIFAPAKTPPAVIKTLNEAINEALVDPALRGKLLTAGLTPHGGPPDDLTAQVKHDQQMIGELVKRVDLKGGT